MGIPHFSQGYPPDGSSLGNTKTVIRGNLDGTFLTLGIDHVNNNGSPGSNPAGYHTVIHEVTQTSAPANIVGVNQIFSLIPPSGIPDAVNPQLFNLTNSILSQMTGRQATQNGFVWCAGMLIQWGIINGTHGADNHFSPGDPISVSFNAVSGNFNFPTECLSIWTQPLALSTNEPASSSTATVAIDKDSITAAGFSGKFTSGGSSYTNFFWIAIGN